MTVSSLHDPSALRRLLTNSKNPKPEPPQRHQPLSIIPTAGRVPRGIEWLWSDLVPLQGVSLLAGEGGFGKSMLTCLLAAELSHGSLEGNLYGSPSRTLIASAEDTVDQVIVPRLIAAGANRDYIDVLSVDVDKPLVPDLALELGQKIAETEARLVVIDPLNAFLGRALNTWSDSAIRSAIRPLAELTEEHDCAVLIVVHLNKGSSQDFRQRVSGSSGYINAARSCLLMAPHPDNEHERVVAVGKGNWAKPRPALVYAIEEAPLRVQGSTPEKIYVPRLTYLRDEDLSSHDVLAGPDSEERSKLDAACAFLQGELAFGPVAANQIRLSAEANGHARATITRAKEKLGVTARRQGSSPKSPWEWILELEDNQTNDAQEQVPKAVEPLEGDHLCEPHEMAVSGALARTDAQPSELSICTQLTPTDAEILALFSERGDDISDWPKALQALAIAEYRKWHP